MISIYEAFAAIGINLDPLPYPNQIRCPLSSHSDEHPSARIYPSENTGFCFSCKTYFTPLSILAIHGGFGYKKAFEMIGDIIVYNKPARNFNSLFKFAVNQIGYNETLDHYLNLSIINENTYDDLAEYVNKELGIML